MSDVLALAIAAYHGGTLEIADAQFRIPKSVTPVTSATPTTR